MSALVRNAVFERIVRVPLPFRHGKPDASDGNRRSTNAAVGLNLLPNKIRIVRHTWIAGTPSVCSQSRIPVGPGSRFFTGSNQIDSTPRDMWD